MIKRISILLIALIITLSCGTGRKTKFEPVPFPDATPPAMLTDVQDRADWVAQHYWDNLTNPERTYPSDSILVSGVHIEDVEQRFSNWVSVLEMVHPKTAEKSVARLFDRISECEAKSADSQMMETFADLIEKYLYDPNSPFRNEDYYGVFASRLSGWDGLAPELRGKYMYQASRCALNKVGTKAADFSFADKRGQTRTLYQIKAPLTLLFFSNPGCDACMNIINVLKGEPGIANLISSGRLAVLNIYIDEDIAAWRSYMPIYPDEWYNGFDQNLMIRNEVLYDVRAIPSLYILDQEKNVIMKDAPEDRVFSYLQQYSMYQ